METLLVLIVLVIVLDIVTLRWGFDSTDKIDSPEWERRATWYARLAGREKETRLLQDYLACFDGDHKGTPLP
jgi:hypothetical protein